MTGWKFFHRYTAWDDQSALFMRFEDRTGARRFVMPLQSVGVSSHAPYDTPTLVETVTAGQDGVGDVTGFLQAALDCAWERGLRPQEFRDHANELSAVRYHLEDMRALAKVPVRIEGGRGR